MTDVHTRARASYYRGSVPDDELFSPDDAAERRRIYAQRVEQADRVVLVAVLGEGRAGFALSGPPLHPAADGRAYASCTS